MVFLEDKNNEMSSFSVEPCFEDIRNDWPSEIQTGSLMDTECSVSIASSSDFRKCLSQKQDDPSTTARLQSLRNLRVKYLLVNLVVMLADGLQGTHLYVLYEGYGFNVASLYALGFTAGAVTTPITGPLIDKFGRKKSAMLYCGLEIGINLLEQYPFLSGLLASRIIGGITTNLLSSVFETWLDTEFRRHCNADFSDSDTTITFETKKEDEERDLRNEYEFIMRDSVIVSNLASIASGYLAHILAERYGPVGPFRGAVTCTGFALVAIFLLWTENYGESLKYSNGDDKVGSKAEHYGGKDEFGYRSRSSKTVKDYVSEAVTVFVSNPKVIYLSIIQGLSAGSLQIFVFLWSPTLQSFSTSEKMSIDTGGGLTRPLAIICHWALDRSGEPAYGLIFGAFMAAGVTGGLFAPYIRKLCGLMFLQSECCPSTNTFEVGGVTVRPMELEFLVGMNYIFAAALMLVPTLLRKSAPESLPLALTAFFAYEFLVGINMTCEGVIRSVYLPSDDRATLMTAPRMIVNLAVSLGVLLTKYTQPHTVFAGIAFLMASSGVLQLSFMTRHEWSFIRRKSVHHIHRASASVSSMVWPPISEYSRSERPKQD